MFLKMRPTFVYGTLMAEEVVQGLIGRVPVIKDQVFVTGFKRFKVGKILALSFHI
jgi:hypothetical protein